MTACGKTLLQKAPILMALAVALFAIALISMTLQRCNQLGGINS